MRIAIVSDDQQPAREELSHVAALRRVFLEEICAVESADVVISTSHRAAGTVTAAMNVPHVCYVTDVDDTIPIAENDRLQRFDAQFATQSPATLTATEVERFAALKITHYLAGNAAAAARLRQEIGQPVKVIYPAVDTHFFRPQKQRRSNHFLVIADPADTHALELAVEATRQTGRGLVVGVESSAPLSPLSPQDRHVEFVDITDPAELYDQLCRCQALLCLRTSSFDTNVIRAQACGTPVLVPAGGCLAELILDAEQPGPGTGLLIDELTPAGVASAMLELERRPHKCSAALASAQAQTFSHPRFELEIRNYLDAVLAAWLTHVPDTAIGDEQRRAA